MSINLNPRIAFITTVRHNVGDDFVREGILYLLTESIGDYKVSLVHKHLPITVRKELAWIYNIGVAKLFDRMVPGLALRVTRCLDRNLPIFKHTDAVQNCDILVQSGAPIYWKHPTGSCADNEWWDDLIVRRWKIRKNRGIFLNLAGGTCQRWGSDGKEFAADEKTLNYICDSINTAQLTTLRDNLSSKVLKLIGKQAPVLPCTSIFAVDNLKITPSKK